MPCAYTIFSAAMMLHQLGLCPTQWPSEQTYKSFLDKYSLLGSAEPKASQSLDSGDAAPASSVMAPPSRDSTSEPLDFSGDAVSSPSVAATGLKGCLKSRGETGRPKKSVRFISESDDQVALCGQTGEAIPPRPKEHKPKVTPKATCAVAFKRKDDFLRSEDHAIPRACIPIAARLAYAPTLLKTVEMDRVLDDDPLISSAPASPSPFADQDDACEANLREAEENTRSIHTHGILRLLVRYKLGPADPVLRLAKELHLYAAFELADRMEYEDWDITWEAHELGHF